MKIKFAFMQLNERELIRLAELAQSEPVVAKVYEELLSYEEDISKLYYVTLSEAIRGVCLKIKNETIDMDDPYTKAIMRLAETGDKVFNTLQRGKADVTPAEDEEVIRNKRIAKVRNIAT